MAITRKPTKTTGAAASEAADAFIAGAPDAGVDTPPALRRVRKGRKVQITLTIAEPLLEPSLIALKTRRPPVGGQ